MMDGVLILHIVGVLVALDLVVGLVSTLWLSCSFIIVVRKK